MWYHHHRLHKGKISKQISYSTCKTQDRVERKFMPRTHIYFFILCLLILYYSLFLAEINDALHDHTNKKVVMSYSENECISEMNYTLTSIQTSRESYT